MMRLKTGFLLVLLLQLALSGCGGGSSSDRGAESAPQSASSNSGTLTTSDAPVSQGRAGAQAEIRDVSLSQADASQAASVPTERKIIRNAALTIESDAPAEGQRRIASLAEQRGGFVVTSESRHQGGDGDGGAYEVVTMEVRVPAAQFDAALAEIRGVGSAVVDEKITGQDVTEEYIDLEARVRTQRALEAQLLELLKRAGGVTEALEVQRALATVRTEIERVEGRRRFLENQSSLSTIKVTLRPAGVLAGASTRGFFQGLKRAFSNGIDVALFITLGLIQIIIALIPVFLLVVLPIVLLFRFLLRRRRRNPPTPLPPTADAPPTAG